MALSDSQWRAWLAAEAKDPVVLIEAHYHDGSEKTAHWSDAGYIDPFDVDAPNYLPVIVSDVIVNESLSSSVLQDVEVQLYDASMLAWKFVGYDFHVWFGDRSWPRSDFVKQATEKTHNIAISDARIIRFQFADLGDIYFEQLVNGNGLGAAAGLPFVFGRPFNFKPARGGTSVRFQWFTPGVISSAAVVRDKGVPVAVAMNQLAFDGTGDGTYCGFDLVAAPAGEVTVDLATVTDFFGTPVPLNADLYSILQAMNNYIQIPIPLSSSVSGWNDVDLSYVFYQYGTVRQMLNELCDSLGLNSRINKAGELELLRVDEIGEPTRLVVDGNLSSRLSLESIEPPYKQLELGWRRNWTVQGNDTIAGSVSGANAALYLREYSYMKETRTLTGYPFVRNQKRETLIREETDASAELDRRWLLRADEHRTCSGAGDGSFIADKVGDTVTVMSSDYGFQDGVDVVIVSNNINLTKQSSKFMIWV